MRINEDIKRRFAELADQVIKFRLVHSDFDELGQYKADEWRAWATSVMNLLHGAFTRDSPHVENFKQVYLTCRGYPNEFDALKGIFWGAKADYDGGYIFSIERSLIGEIFTDFVSISEAALEEQQKDVAAVVACAALEDALKRYATLEGLAVEGKTMQEVVNALKGLGAIHGAQKGLLDSMVKTRNNAMHADWAKIQTEDVGSVLGFVKHFLVERF